MTAILNILETYVTESWCLLRRTPHLQVSAYTLRRQIRFNLLLQFVCELPCYVQHSNNLQFLIDYILLTAWEKTRRQKYIKCIQPGDRKRWMKSPKHVSMKMSKKQLQTIVKLVPMEDARLSLQKIFMHSKEHQNPTANDIHHGVFRLPPPSVALLGSFQSINV